jgi:N-acetylglucosaminyldiphosphoundecaprenol N-acetyl-beta-D-mannosaminyltransferase
MTAGVRRLALPDGLVADAGTRSEIVAECRALFARSRATGAPAVVTALHVGGLVSHATPGFSEALAQSDLVCIDGSAVLLLARAARARGVERAPTTDVGPLVIADLAQYLQRPVRVALLGGPPSLAERAGAALNDSLPAEGVWMGSGYRNDWDHALKSIQQAAPDILLVGLGSPRETLFVAEYRESLPGCLVVTCGGWFGFLAGDERRAPTWMRALHLEWLSRVVQDPARLWKRYARGIPATLRALILVLVASRPNARRGSCDG